MATYTSKQEVVLTPNEVREIIMASVRRSMNVDEKAEMKVRMTNCETKDPDALYTGELYDVRIVVNVQEEVGVPGTLGSKPDGIKDWR